MFLENLNVWQMKLSKNGNCAIVGEGCLLVHLFVNWGLKIKLSKCFPETQLKVNEPNSSSERQK